MKNILVAIDFSDCSVNALEHAISIAAKGNYNIIMMWVNNPTTTKILLSSDQSSEMIKEVENQFRKLIAKYSKSFKNGILSYIIREGKIYREIALEAESRNALLVVAGTHGTSGFEEFWIGSNATKIVSLAPCPVITIRSGVKVNHDLKKIVMPVDSTPETRQKASFTALIAKLFGAEIYLLALYTTKIGAIRENINNYAKQISHFMEEENIPCHLETSETDNIARATIDYAEKIGANLISIMTEQETATSNLWLGPYAHQLVNHSPIPVLSIHPADLDISMPH
ncbi:MAG TPA: universal stress protein [Bacteroidales bacterium]|nr:universal stress protein [Bacteroidales bacterium]